MEINLKKCFIALAVFVGLFVYVKDHYTYKDVLAYSKKHPSVETSPKLDYMAGMAMYLKSKYPESAEAFEQLLTDYPTSQYTAKALFRLGTVYCEMSKWEQARVQFQRYVDEYPSGPDVEAVRQKHEIIKFK
jgi:TolA-binding protein